MKTRKKGQLTAWQFLALGYLTVIMIGAALLCLPIATREGQRTSFIGALFTSTSATCVTGLVPYDTNAHWTAFGQTVILLLIQLGGLGFMTFVSLMLRLFGKNIGLHQSKILMLSSGENKRSELKRLFKRILIGSLSCEIIGAGLLSIRFTRQFGFGKGIWYAVWHSVSAFCNAGFDLMGGVFGGETFVSLTAYATDPLVSLTIAGLVIVGGLGFCVWDDLVESKGNIKKFRLHTKIVLLMNFILLAASTLLFLLFERNNPTFASYDFKERLLVSFFSAVTPRTAGFNTVELTALSDSGYLLTVALMFIGGAPGSTAGGIKVTTLFVILMGISSVFAGKRDIEIGKRRIHNSLLRQALAVFVSCLFIIIFATFIISAVEANNEAATFQAVLLETVSAMGTVGLSLGLTPTLSAVSKVILILLMYLGRVGILTIGFAFGEKKDVARVKKPLGDVLIS